MPKNNVQGVNSVGNKGIGIILSSRPLSRRSINVAVSRAVDKLIDADD